MLTATPKATPRTRSKCPAEMARAGFGFDSAVGIGEVIVDERSPDNPTLSRKAKARQGWGSPHENLTADNRKIKQGLSNGKSKSNRKGKQEQEQPKEQARTRATERASRG